MAISPAAIEKFLTKIHAPRPAVKGMAPEQLREMIYNATGAEYQELVPSRPHQLEGVAFAAYQQRALLFYWMRLGKSKIALEWAAHLRRCGFAKKKALILAHSPTGVEVWEGQAAQFTDADYRGVWPGPEALEQFLTALESDCAGVILSRSTAQALFTEKRLNRKKEPTLYPAHDLLKDAAAFFDHCVIDEIHLYANPYGLPFQLASELVTDCKYRLGLTGTPIGRNPLSLWAQASLIDNGKHLGYLYPFFEAAFCKRVRSHFNPRNFDLVFDQDKKDILQYKVDCLSLAYGKDEVPSAEVFAGRVELRMTREQRKAYNEAVNRLVKLRTGETAEIDAIFVRLRQISSGYLPFVDDNGKAQIVNFKSAKMNWLLEFLDEIPETARCLIFHEFRHTGELICAALASRKITHAWLHGGTRDKSGELARFKSGAAQFLVANTATGGTGIDLPEADYLLFFESPADPITRAQAEARPMARGDRALFLDDLTCSPVEEKILGFIAEGRNLLKSLLAGGSKTARELFAK